jgi:flagellar basal-body rod protein FlgC
MADAISIALSGLMAQSRRVAVSANNIANIATVGVLPTEESPASTVYKPLSVSYLALTAGGKVGGVSTTVTEDQNGYSPVFDPASVYANSEGLIAVPNIDFTKEFVNLMQSKSAFKANLSVLKTEKEMLGELLDALT